MSGPETAPTDANVEPTRRLALSPTEAAEALGVGRSFLYELLQSGQIRSIKLGRRRLIPVAALEAFLEDQ